MRSDTRIGTLDFFICPHEYNNYDAKVVCWSSLLCIDDGTSSKLLGRPLRNPAYWRNLLASEQASSESDRGIASKPAAAGRQELADARVFGNLSGLLYCAR
jgi:hypothetical protein